jgi:hypothetical protein
MRLGLIRFILTSSLATVACATTPTGPTVEDVIRHQAVWTAQRPSNYSFDYARQSQVYDIKCPTAAWRITVQGTTVASAMCMETGQAIASMTLTIDSLFDQARRALDDHALSAIQFDPQLGFPTYLGFAGPPDAAWSEHITHLQQP